MHKLIKTEAPAAPGANDKGHKWSIDETKFIMRKIKEYDSDVGPKKQFRTRKRMWDQIALEMNVEFGSNVNGLQVETRFRVILKRTKKDKMLEFEDMEEQFRDSNDPLNEYSLTSSQLNEYDGKFEEDDYIIADVSDKVPFLSSKNEEMEDENPDSEIYEEQTLQPKPKRMRNNQIYKEMEEDKPDAETCEEQILPLKSKRIRNNQNSGITTPNLDIYLQKKQQLFDESKKLRMEYEKNKERRFKEKEDAKKKRHLEREAGKKQRHMEKMRLISELLRNKDDQNDW